MRAFLKYIAPFLTVFVMATTGLSVLTENTALTNHRIHHVLSAATQASHTPELETPCPLCEAFLTENPILATTIDQAPLIGTIVGYEVLELPASFPRIPRAACARAPPIFLARV